MGKWTTLFQPVLFMGQQYSPYDHFPDTALLTVFNVVTCVPPGDLEGGTTSATGLRVSSAGRAPYRLGVRVCVLVWVSTQSCSALQDCAGNHGFLRSAWFTEICTPFLFSAVQAGESQGRNKAPIQQWRGDHPGTTFKDFILKALMGAAKFLLCEDS